MLIFVDANIISLLDDTLTKMAPTNKMAFGLSRVICTRPSNVSTGIKADVF
jgi:hypothetical protein